MGGVEGLFSSQTLQSCFAIGVAAFLLIRLERELRRLSEAIEQLRRCQVCRFNPDGSSKEKTSGQ
jgi:16S rRNA U1498 N3-methylase RsmE